MCCYFSWFKGYFVKYAFSFDFFIILFFLFLFFSSSSLLFLLFFFLFLWFLFFLNFSLEVDDLDNLYYNNNNSSTSLTHYDRKKESGVKVSKEKPFIKFISNKKFITRYPQDSKFLFTFFFSFSILLSSFLFFSFSLCLFLLIFFCFVFVFFHVFRLMFGIFFLLLFRVLLFWKIKEKMKILNFPVNQLSTLSLWWQKKENGRIWETEFFKRRVDIWICFCDSH